MKQAVLATVLAVVTVTQAEAGPKTVYGDDNRRDLYQVTDAAQLKLAESTVALVFTSSIKFDETRTNATLSTSAYGSRNGLCTDEPFYNQRSAAYCSGSLVGKDLVLTAGHCISDESDCKYTSFVFGWGITSEGPQSDTVSAKNVYTCKKLVKSVYEGSGADWALIQLDREVKDRSPLAINRTGKVEVGTELTMIGHPNGLPTKIAAEAKVRKSEAPGYFVATTDSFRGNSGSAVFNSKTGEIEGVLVRGDADFTRRAGENCYVTNICPEDGCRGEDVTRVSQAADLIPTN